MNKLNIEEEWVLSLNPKERLKKALEWGFLLNELQKKSQKKNLMLERFAAEVSKTWQNIPKSMKS